jgi:UDP-glucose-4-epimerase GalE
LFSVSGPVLVTGGAGYIGSHVFKALAEAGARPICLDTLEKGHDWAVRWESLERGDVGDGRFVEDVFLRHKPRIVIHLAGYIEVGESVARPERYLSNNAAKSRVLIGAALRHKVEAFVFSSTCAVYGLPQSDLLAESHRIAPINPYAASKASVERALDSAAWRGIRAASLRYFNATGADAAAEIGEAHDPETHLLPLAVDAALGLRASLVVHGSDYPTDDGSCVRDYVHVSDLADAHLRAVQWLVRQKATTCSISAPGLVTASGRLSSPSAASSGGRFPMSTALAAPAIRRAWSAASTRPSANSTGIPCAISKRKSRIRCDGGCR